MALNVEVRLLLIGAAVALIILCSAGTALLLLGRPAHVVIGHKNFTESRLLAEIMAQSAERHDGITVQRRELGSTGLCWDALSSGAIHAYPDYTGTLLTDILKQQPLSDPTEALARVRDLLAPNLKLALGEPFGLNDTYVLAMRSDEALTLGIRKISDLAKHPTLVAGFTSEFNQRPDGWRGLAQHYGLQLNRPPLDLSPGHLYQAARDGQVAIISAFSTDARLRQFGLVSLEDDRQFFPAYEGLPVMRRELGERHPKVIAAWRALAGTLDDATMMELNQRVDIGGESVAAVASSFLERLAATAPLPATTVSPSTP